MTCQVHKLVAPQVKFGPEVGEVFIDQPEWKFIVPGRDRGVRGENIPFS